MAWSTAPAIAVNARASRAHRCDAGAEMMEVGDIIGACALHRRCLRRIDTRSPK